MGIFDSIGNAISSAANSVVHGVEDAAKDVAHGVESAAGTVAHGVESFAGDAFNVIKTGATDLVHGVETVATDVEHGVEKAADEVGGFAKKAWKAVSNWAGPALSGIGDGIVDFAKGIGAGVVEFGKGIFVDGIGGFASNLIHGHVKEAFDSLIHGADEAFFQAPQRMINGAIDGVQEVTDGITQLLPDAVGKPLRQVVDRAAEDVRTVANTVVELGRDVYRGLAETPVNFVNDLYKAGDKLVHGDFKGAAEQFGMAFVNAGAHVLNTAGDMVTRTLQGVEHVVMTTIGLDPPSRKLTDDEKKLLRSVYGDSVDLDSIRIVKGGPLQNAMASHTVGNTIYMPDSDVGDGSLFKADGSLSDYGSTLIHETCHVWQSQNGGGEYIGQSLFNQAKGIVDGGDRNLAYDYTKDVANGVPFEDLNPEQQAYYVQMVLGPILDQPGDPVTNIDNSSLSDADKAYAKAVFEDIRSGEGAA